MSEPAAPWIEPAEERRPSMQALGLVKTFGPADTGVGSTGSNRYRLRSRI